MRINIFQYLKNYSTDVVLINRLLISAFVGINKLEVKNNKLLKTYLINELDDDYSYLLEFLNILDGEFNLENLVELFEFVISPEDKVINGAVYTPSNIRSFIIENSFSKVQINRNLKLADISCGCGGFLADSAILLNEKTGNSFHKIFRNNIYGVDIKEYSIERTKLLLTLVALQHGEDKEDFQFNLFVANSLNFEWEIKFDIILGNPPYVCSRNIDADSKKYLENWSVCSTGHPDLYIPFFQIALEQLNDNGVLGYITVNSFFKSINGRALRDYFIRRKSEFELIDFGGEQIFQARSTYTCICLIRNSTSEFIKYKKVKSADLKSGIKSFVKRKYDDLENEDGWNFRNIELIKKIEEIGTPFGKRYKTRNGIATLKNRIYIFDPVDEDKYFYFLKYEDTVFPIEKTICKNIINPNKLTSLTEINSIKKKIIFPYQYLNDSKQPVIMKEEYFQTRYPHAYRYLSLQKNTLSTRDKGNGKYETWYAYGRNQSLEIMRNKMFFPHIAPNTPNFIITDEDLLFYNGLAVVDDEIIQLELIKILFSSRIFWFYITSTSKPYASGYYSLSRNYIKNFGVYDFSQEDINYMLNEGDKCALDRFIEKKYGIELDS